MAAYSSPELDHADDGAEEVRASCCSCSVVVVVVAAAVVVLILILVRSCYFRGGSVAKVV